MIGRSGSREENDSHVSSTNEVGYSTRSPRLFVFTAASNGPGLLSCPGKNITLKLTVISVSLLLCVLVDGVAVSVKPMT